MLTTINDSRFQIQTAGDLQNPAVILIHGFPLSHTLWEPQIAPLSQKYFVVAYDMRGHGQSDVGDGQYTLEGHVEDLLSIMDWLGLREAVLVGLSMGGYIALRLAEKTPSRVRALVLCDTKSEADDNAGKLKRAAALKDVKQNGSSPYAKTSVQSLFSEETKNKNPKLLTKVRKVIEKTTPLAIAGNLLALASRTDTTPSLEKITKPTLIVVGEHDIITPPSLARGMHSKIQGSQLKIIPHAGHLSNLENPSYFNEVLLDFLSRCS